MRVTIGRGVRAALLAGVAMLPEIASAQTAPASEPVNADAPQGQQPAGEGNEDLSDIVVTGTTSRDRPLITASADITYANRDDIDRRAPRSTADLLELVPGIYVEGTAGQVSNNYSVRGLQGGGQRFVQLEEDGLPILYGGGGADFFFDQDLTIERLEAVKGGSSGVLTVNGAGATINFISKRPNHERFEGAGRVTGYDYGLKRGEFYLSGPIAEGLAFNVGGYVQSTPGVRDNPFEYDGYRFKGALEYKFEDGGFIRITGKGGNLENAYYATMPYAYNNGNPRSVPGLDSQFGNIGGDAFRKIEVPVSTFVDSDGTRAFNGRDGVRSKTAQIRLDIEKPITEGFDVFARARYLKYSYDFNGIFPGSSTGNGGLTSAVDYLTLGGQSPIDSLLQAGATRFNPARFGIRNRRTGVVLGSNQTAELAALNGNGLLQRTTLNHDYVNGKDFGANVGARWEFESGAFKNSLTAGAMYYDVRRRQDQSATASVVNDVRTNSDIYDIVALNGANQVIGTLSDNGLVSYGDWGAGIRNSRDKALSLYANDELAIGDSLRIDGGIRWEQDDALFLEGRNASAADPANRIVEIRPGVFEQLVPAGREGVLPTIGSTFDGTFNRTARKQDKIAWTVGANYLFTPNFAIYARYADGFQTNNVNPITTIKLYEAGVRYQYGRFFTGSVTVFKTDFDDQFYEVFDPLTPNAPTQYVADLRTKGVEVDVVVRPIDWFAVDFQGVFQKPELTNLVSTSPGINGSDFAGNKPERTPSSLWTVTPTITLPNGLGEIYGRYKYVGRTFADNGNNVPLPSYGVTSVGVSLNVNDNIQVAFNAENIFDVVGLTEGNPRQGQTQVVTDGFFYARGIVGPTYGGSITFRF